MFKDREDDYFEFRDLIANHYNMNFHEVLILGSAKLGYSYHKDSVFSPNSDIDVALVNQNLFEQFCKDICDYQYEKSKSLFTTTKIEEDQYCRFLKYIVRGLRIKSLIIYETYFHILIINIYFKICNNII